MASFIVEAMVPGIHELIQGHNFRVLVDIRENLEIKNLENRALYGIRTFAVSVTLSRTVSLSGMMAHIQVG